ncbi:21918_t:CDS:2 [Gigaspora margarita]|uniref:21918_t:CDS:1 n=1 Tax=Gigaspora margarita TaxID=4874 RepID=A0ABN7WSM0_GIGMA|nr:21918_t:CDS:2 [Gigaspora margarita]
MANNALNTAANAITALAHALRRGATKANYWSPAHKLELDSAYMENNA